MGDYNDLDFSDLDPNDGWDDTSGCEMCPRCERIYSANGGYIGDVYDQWGKHYEDRHDSDPNDGPFFCPDCFDAVKDDMLPVTKADQHVTLENFEE